MQNFMTLNVSIMYEVTYNTSCTHMLHYIITTSWPDYSRVHSVHTAISRNIPVFLHVHLYLQVYHAQRKFSSYHVLLLSCKPTNKTLK